MFAFECGGRRYYRFRSEDFIPVGRLLAIQDVYAELEAGVDRQYLIKLFETVEQLLDKGKLVQASQLLMLARERLQDITHVMLLYKLAAIFYVEEGEPLSRFSHEEAERKIAHWIAHGCHDFFLKKPIADLLPSFESLGMSLTTYMSAQVEAVSRVYKYHISLLQENQSSADTLNYLQRQWQLLNQLKQSLNSAIANT